MQTTFLTGAQKPLPDDGSRITGDAYYTPDNVARACVSVIRHTPFWRRLPTWGTSTVFWEPHVGGGAWTRALLDLTNATVIASDVDMGADGLHPQEYPGQRRALAEARGGVDFATFREWDNRARWIIGNPPYDRARLHTERALNATRQHVVFLLRLAFVESLKRVDFWQRYPARHVWMLASRPSFTAGGGTDSAAYGLFWWDIHHRGPMTCTPCWDWKSEAVKP